MEKLRNMKVEIKMLQLKVVISFLIVIGIVESTLNPSGTKCGQKKCLTTEYCSPFDSQCSSCSSICDATHHNHEADLCVKDCQEYLHDQRYVLRAELNQDGNLREEVERLSILIKVSFALTIFIILTLVFLLMKTFFKLTRIRDALIKVFGKKWIKSTNSDKVRNDVESGSGAVKSQQQNNARLIMPTISGRVAPSSQSSNGCSTTHTSSTTLSRREATEDNTLDFAYDNPAMIPSPDTARIKSKRESSF